MWSFEGTFLHKWSCIRVNDVGITPNGKTMLAVCQEKKIKAFDVETKAELW
jgi:hypothetical protein